MQIVSAIFWGIGIGTFKFSGLGYQPKPILYYFIYLIEKY